MLIPPLWMRKWCEKPFWGHRKGPWWAVGFLFFFYQKKKNMKHMDTWKHGHHEKRFGVRGIIWIPTSGHGILFPCLCLLDDPPEAAPRAGVECAMPSGSGCARCMAYWGSLVWVISMQFHPAFGGGPGIHLFRSTNQCCMGKEVSGVWWRRETVGPGICYPVLVFCC
jgi:hypothetical protein